MRAKTVLTMLLGTLCFYGCDETPAPDKPDSGVVGNDDAGATLDTAPRPDTVSREDSAPAVRDAVVADAPPPAAKSGKWLTIEGAQPVSSGASVTALGSADGSGHTRVLVAGGFDWQPLPEEGNIQIKTATTAAWVYDMTARSFQPAGNMKVARYYHTATLLPDGRVLVVGGRGEPDDEGLASTEIFDPSKSVEEAWVAGPPLIGGPRYGHAAVLLDDGRVFVIGSSRDGFEDSLEAFEISDPQNQPNGRWESLAEPLRHKRVSPAVVKLASGKILVAGGSDYERVDTVELFDPAQGQFRVLGATDGETDVAQTLSVHKDTPSLVPYTDRSGKEKVLVVGGSSSDDAKDEIIDPGFEVIRSINHPFGAPQKEAATLLSDGRVLVCGGDQRETDSWLSFVFDPRSVSPTWNAMPNMRVGRAEHQAVTLKDGTVLVVGGVTAVDAAIERAELFVPGDTPDPVTPTPKLTWQRLATIEGNPRIYSVWGVAVSDLWVGAEWAVHHWDGEKWTEHELPDGPAYGGDVIALAGNAADDIYALGERGRVWHYDGEAWSLVREEGDSAPGSGLWVSGKKVYIAVDNEVWFTAGELAADSESLLSWTQQYAAAPEAFSSHDLNAIWGNDSEVFSAGQSGVFLQLVDGNWEPRAFPALRSITTVVGEGDTAYFIGLGGLAIRRVAGAFQALDSRTQASLLAGSVADGRAFAAGGNATLLHHWGGETYWHALAVPKEIGSTSLLGVWNKADDVVVIAAERKGVYRGTFPSAQ